MAKRFAICKFAGRHFTRFSVVADSDLVEDAQTALDEAVDEFLNSLNRPNECAVAPAIGPVAYNDGILLVVYVKHPRTRSTLDEVARDLADRQP